MDFRIAEMPAEAAETVLDFATGGKPKVAPPVRDADPFRHPDARRRFRVMRDMDELARSLGHPKPAAQPSKSRAACSAAAVIASLGDSAQPVLRSPAATPLIDKWMPRCSRSLAGSPSLRFR